MTIVADSGAQPGLSMIALGLLAGVAGLWVYSATQDQSTIHPRQHRRSSTSSTHSDGAVRTTLHRTRTIRRSRRQMSSDSIAEEIRDTDFGLDTTGSADQAASATVNARPHDVLDTGNDDEESESEENGTDADMRLLQLLCTISEDQSRRNGIIHRGTTCNSCQETPIRGIRYKCAQCATVDICEACEANDVHRHHVMLRISVPIPPLMNPRMPLIRKLYPGTLQPKELPRDVRKELETTTCLDRIDIISLYNEFCVLASNIDGVEAITRTSFYKCLGQFGGADSVLASRLFAYYDEDGDNLITFPEMARGFSAYNKGTPEEKAPGVFRAYDVDGDNMLSRDDLRIMLEAFADASREITKNMVRALEDDVLEVPSRLLPGQPISAAFTAPIPTHSPSALDKEVHALRAEVHALRESAAVRREVLDEQGEGESDTSSEGSGAATTSATVGTIASLRMPRRMSANVTVSNDGSGPTASDTALPGAEHADQPVVPATNNQNNIAAAVAAFTDIVQANTLNPLATSIDLLAASSDPRNTLHVSTAWHDANEDDDWSVMEALSQDTIRLMIDEIFTEAAPRDPICMTYSEFYEYLQRNSSLAMYFEVLGTIF
ncbi:hypothetical protein GGH96_000156 [Coemansia sp. RSA 1972]|nr:hypothetical protein GGH96_000156 [Coemansia sp. RSA 1972]